MRERGSLTGITVTQSSTRPYPITLHYVNSLLCDHTTFTPQVDLYNRMVLRLTEYLLSVNPSFTVEGHTGLSPEKVGDFSLPLDRTCPEPTA